MEDEQDFSEIDSMLEAAKQAKNAALSEYNRLQRMKIAFVKRPEEMRKKRIKSVASEILRLAPKIRAKDQDLVRLKYLHELSGSKIEMEEIRQFIIDNPKGMVPEKVLSFVSDMM